VYLAGYHGPQRDADRQDVDDLLQDGACRGRKIPQRGNDHRDQGKAHADHNRLQRNPFGPPGNEDRIGDGVNPVNREYDVRGLG